MFKAEFFLNPSAQTMFPGINLNSLSDISAIAFKVKQIDKPRVTMTSQELNNYNKKRIVYTKIDYADATIRIYDTVDNSVLSFWVNYFTYYFGDSRTKSSAAESMNPTDAKFIDDTGWGLRPLTEDTNFFNKISVSAFFAGTTTKFSYMNPKITGIDWQQHDYGSTDLEEATITFKYEYIQYEKFGVPTTEDTGFRQTDVLDIDSRGTGSIFTSQPQLFTQQSDDQYQASSGINLTEQFRQTVTNPTPTPPSTVPASVGRSLTFNG